MSKGRALSKAQKLLQKRRFSEVIRICDKVLAGLGQPLAEGEDEQAIRCFFSSLEEFTQVAMAYGQLLDCSPRLAKKSLLWIGNTPAEAALLK